VDHHGHAGEIALWSEPRLDTARAQCRRG
jgi:hypothetical protein